MAIRKANAIWNGDLKSGRGIINVESGIFNDVEYSFSKRFENEPGTNPEELIAAAHASCFSQALANSLAIAGFAVKSIQTEDRVHLDKVADGFSITKIEVICDAEVINIDEELFLKYAEDTKKNCPVAKALTGVNFELKATLNHSEVHR